MRAQRRSRSWLIGVGVGTFAALLLLWSPGRADAACEVDFCTTGTTDPSGVYQLDVTPAAIAFGFPALTDCVWEDVEADFGDGSPNGEYEFDAAVGISESHQFPAPGVYTVHVYAREGTHSGSGGPCPDMEIEAVVTYPPPAPPPTPPPGETGGSGAPPAPAGPSTEQRAVDPPYWRNCGAIRAHAVYCKKARRVAGTARAFISRARLAKGATFRAAGFSCKLRQSGKRPLACRQGPKRILAPL